MILAQVYHPNTEAVIREGRCLFADDAAPLDERSVVEPRTLRDAAGQAWTVEVTTFADPRLAALLEMRREAELVQAALRGRPFDHPEAQITLLFSLPLPGLPPTVIAEAAASPASNEGRTAAVQARLVTAAQEVLTSGEQVLTVPVLAAAAGMSVTTVREHWQTLARTLHLRATHRRTRRAMPHGGVRFYRAEVLMRRGRWVPPPRAPVGAAAAVAPAMMDQADKEVIILRLIYHRAVRSWHILPPHSVHRLRGCRPRRGRPRPRYVRRE